MVNRHLVSDGWESLLAGLRTAKVERAYAPANVGNICRPHSARKPHPVVLPHDVVEVCSLREVDMLLVQLESETLAKIVERRLCCLLIKYIFWDMSSKQFPLPSICSDANTCHVYVAERRQLLILQQQCVHLLTYIRIDTRRVSSCQHVFHIIGANLSFR